MKRALQYVILIILVSAAGIILTNQNAFRPVFQQAEQKAYSAVHKPCSEPLKYAIGNVDPRFNISTSDLQNIANQAAEIWDKAAGRDLFQYDPNAQFKINMIFDTRQQQVIDSQKLENNLQTLESSHQAIMSQYNSLSSTYKKKTDDYNKAVSDYQDELNKYNDEVDSWNAKGGAPPDVYKDIEKEKQDLEDTFNQLEQERQAINKLIGQSNVLVQKDQTVINSYNSNVGTYKDKYGGSTEFDKGVYTGTEIDIYEFRGKDDLELTLTHELGHALGMQHVQNSQSIMYYLMQDQSLTNLQPTAEDLAELKSVCQLP